MRLRCVDLLPMPLLPLSLLLSLLLHAAAGFFLLNRDAVPASVHSSRAAHQPVVVQLMLAPVEEQQAPVVRRVEPVPQPQPQRQAVQVPSSNPAKPLALAGRTRTEAAPAPARLTPAEPEVKADTQVSQPGTSVPQLHLAEKSHPVAAPAAPAEVFSRQPAFRLAPQQPRYPVQARRRNQQGLVLLEVRLDERGAQREIRLIRSSGFSSLDNAALEAVSGWRFHPETVNGKGVPSRVHIPIEFALLASR
jgi:protein TonB